MSIIIKESLDIASEKKYDLERSRNIILDYPLVILYIVGYKKNKVLLSFTIYYYYSTPYANS